MTAVVDIAEVTGQEPVVVEDEPLAVRCAATTCLITAAIAADVEAVARRIHAAGLRAAFPFVHVSSNALPTDAAQFSEACAGLFDAARGGSLLVTNVEAMPAVVQEYLIEAFVQLQAVSNPLDAVRLIAGTTVILHDCIVAGTFSERLFYRLNIIHIVMPGCLSTPIR
jgi:DNA-binding NtrC family response regulator